MKIYHIAYRSDWEQSRLEGAYRANTLLTEGFIHCSELGQVLKPANYLYAGQSGLVLLVIRLEKVQAPVLYEAPPDAIETFPHIYGALNIDAVEDVVDFPCGPDGLFDLPISLKG